MCVYSYIPNHHALFWPIPKISYTVSEHFVLLAFLYYQCHDSFGRELCGSIRSNNFFLPASTECQGEWISVIYSWYTSSTVPVCIANSSRETSIPDAYQQPNAVLLLLDLIDAPTDAGSSENYASKNEHRQSTESVPMGDALAGNRFETSDLYGDLTGSDPKNVSDLVNNSPKFKEEISHKEVSTTFFTEEEDVCPICLEGSISDFSPHVWEIITSIVYSCMHVVYWVYINYVLAVHS